MKLIKLQLFQFMFFTSICFGGIIYPACGQAKIDVYISEFMAINSSMLKDDFGEFSDWIEIHNPTNSAVNLKGWYLTDDAKTPTKWMFPEISIAPDGYLLLFASDRNLTDPTKTMHLNFKLSGSGEYLALVNPDGKTVVSDFGAAYPAQYSDISYGFANAENRHFAISTPGKANILDQFLPPPVFSVKRGFYSSPFDVSLSSPIPDAKIYYTLNGAIPDSIIGKLYTGKITITTTTPLRAIVCKNGSSPSISATNTYIFLNDVINQPADPAGYPPFWGPYAQISGNAIADYGMDPQICQAPAYKDLMINSLKSIPTIVITTKPGNLFSNSTNADTGGIYIYTNPPTGGIGEGWEREASAEYIVPNQTDGFQINCGLTLHGGHSRLPEKSPKHSFRLLFKDEYGPTKLKFNLFDKEENATDEYNVLVVKGTFGNTWYHWSPGQRIHAQYIHDSWAKDTQRDMSQLSAHNKFVHLYLNGLYWGLYNITERLDAAFMQSYKNGEEADYDVIKDYSEIVDGDLIAWQNLLGAANKGLVDNASYQKIQGNNADGTRNTAYEKLLDVDNLIDYMLLNFIGGNTDWDHHNWAVGRNRITKDKGFQFFAWDTELIFTGENDNVVNENNDNCPSRIYTKLRDNAEFRLLFADHVSRHFFNNGLLTPKANSDRWMKRANEIDMAIISESARWGDYRLNVHPYNQGPYSLYTKNDWLVEQKRLVDSYFPARTQIVLNQLKAIGLYTTIDAPVFNQHGGNVLTGFDLKISAKSGVIYYTTDGTDPRLIGGSISNSAKIYPEKAFKITDTTRIKSRAKLNTTWSAITEAVFYPGTQVGINNLQESSKIFCSVFPNPFNNLIQFEYFVDEAANTQILIYSVDGKLIETVFNGFQSTGKQSFIWSGNHLPNGIFYYQISCNQQKYTGKLIKQ